MILVDTSVWIDHLRTGDTKLATLLEEGVVCTHPGVIVELALGRMRHRNAVIGLIRGLPHAPVAAPEELLHFIEAHALHGAGIGYVDASLLASVRLAGTLTLWTRDHALGAAAAAEFCFDAVLGEGKTGHAMDGWGRGPERNAPRGWLTTQ